MQFVARNVAKVELGSTSATVAHNIARKVVLCVRALSLGEVIFHIYFVEEKTEV